MHVVYRFCSTECEVIRGPQNDITQEWRLCLWITTLIQYCLMAGTCYWRRNQLSCLCHSLLAEGSGEYDLRGRRRWGGHCQMAPQWPCDYGCSVSHVNHPLSTESWGQLCPGPEGIAFGKKVLRAVWTQAAGYLCALPCSFSCDFSSNY